MGAPLTDAVGEARLGLVAQADSAPSTETAPTADPEITAQLAALQTMDIHDLRIRWRRLFRKPTPDYLPRYLLARMIAYRIQANAFGDLDRETVRYLDQVAKALRRRKALDPGTGAIGDMPAVPAVPMTRGLKPGTLLAREHHGVLHRVMVVDGGYAWNGATYRSLSEVARAITGTNWNGPRFFGLRDARPTADAASREMVS
jgi:hypothetical protein